MAKLCFITLGCVKNDVDSDTLSALSAASGHTLTKDPRKADTLVLNTCGFIAQAKAESVEKILEITSLAQKTGQTVVVFGCLVKRYFNELEAELGEVDLFIASTNGSEVASCLLEYMEGKSRVGAPQMSNSDDQIGSMRKFESPSRLGDRLGHIVQGKRRGKIRRPTKSNYAYLKIADGCSSNCSFCSIPSIKGPYQSRELTDIVEEALELASYGVRELILVAQDTALYGRDLNGRTDFITLLKALNEVPGTLALRVLYIKPESLTKELIDLWAELPALVPYFDIPLQHVSKHILKSMNRSYSKQDILELFAGIRNQHRSAAFRTAFIVGYPGETETDVDELEEFIKQAAFENVSFFAFSPEEGTSAATLPSELSDDEVRNRIARLQATQEQISMDRSDQMVLQGEPLSAMMDSRDQRTLYHHLPPLQEIFSDFISAEVKFAGRAHILSKLPHTDGITYVGFKTKKEASEAAKAGIIKVLPKASLGYEMYAEVI